MEDAAITIVGCGPGASDYLTRAAVDAVSRADVLIGPQRLLELFPDATGERVQVGSAVEDTLDRIQEAACAGTVAVLVTGDPGFFSLARLVIKHFGRDRCRVIPGISSVQTAFARIGLDWSDALMISAHRNDPDVEETWTNTDKIAVLGGRDSSLEWVAERLLPALDEPRIFVCENLTLDDETVQEVAPQDLPSFRASPRTVVLIVRRSVLT